MSNVRRGDRIDLDEQTITCVLADDHSAIAKLVSRYLTDHGISVLATASHGKEAVEKLARTAPDVAILDVHMPGMGGLKVAKSALDADPNLGVVFYTGFSDRALLYAGVDIGVRGFVPKEASLGELVRAVRTVAAGETYIDPVLGGSVVISGQTQDAATALSKRERQVLRLLAEGLRNEEIGEELFVSADSVRTYSGRAMAKLGAQTRTEAVALAIRRSLIS